MSLIGQVIQVHGMNLVYGRLTQGRMAKGQNSLFFLRRAYVVAAEKVKVPHTASILREVSTGESEKKEAGKNAIWMKDPKTGNWMPENHFDEVDVAELREKLLSKKSHS